MNLIVEDLHPDALKIGLTKAEIRAAAESRLRSARLYNSEATNYLYINSNVVDPAFSTSLKYQKEVHDIASNQRFTTTTWSRSLTGTTRKNPGFILSGISRLLDRFLVEFLRVNEKACEKRFALPNPRNDE